MMLEGLELNYKTISAMNARRQEMWKASNPKNYNDFRVFIMGIKGNDELFGDGLVYKGCFNDEPQNFRGQTGAQDDVIPTQDLFSGLTDYYPENKLTSYLMDLRQYRPKIVQTFFGDMREVFQKKALMNYLVDNKKVDGMVMLWRVVDEVYRFRNGHWQFVQKYIMANTKYDRATGGTPITSWLINQIEACLQYQVDIAETFKETGYSNPDRPELEQIFADLSSTLNEKKELLHKQVAYLNKEANYDIELIYGWNKQHDLSDDPALREKCAGHM